MPKVNKKDRVRRLGPGWVTALVLFGLLELSLVIKYLLLGKNVTLFNPQGLISHQQHNLFILLLILLCGAAIPVVLFLYFVAWKFRESNTKSIHRPSSRDSKRLVFSIWAYPILFFFVFAAILIPATHRLEPRKALASDVEPLTIQVIALRWKWLFLYPQEQVASLNYVQLPLNRPVKFELTADDAPMSSFWIPNIGGQLYAMTGHSNPLNLEASKLGDYPGSTAEINGEGFADMIFTAHVSTASEFTQWVGNTKNGPEKLDAAAYASLLKPSEKVTAKSFNSYQSDLYDTVLMKYMGHMQTAESSGHEAHE